MTREEREMDLWTSVYVDVAQHAPHQVPREAADAALAAFRAAFLADKAMAIAAMWLDMTREERGRSGLQEATQYMREGYR